MRRCVIASVQNAVHSGPPARNIPFSNSKQIAGAPPAKPEYSRHGRIPQGDAKGSKFRPKKCEQVRPSFAAGQAWPAAMVSGSTGGLYFFRRFAPSWAASCAASRSVRMRASSADAGS